MYSTVLAAARHGVCVGIKLNITIICHVHVHAYVIYRIYVHTLTKKQTLLSVYFSPIFFPLYDLHWHHTCSHLCAFHHSGIIPYKAGIQDALL